MTKPAEQIADIAALEQVIRAALHYSGPGQRALSDLCDLVEELRKTLIRAGKFAEEIKRGTDAGDAHDCAEHIVHLVEQADADRSEGER